MCCFTQTVESVSETSIFARASTGGRQYLAYSMTVESRLPVAMVLPLPTPPGSAEDAVRFIPLDHYPDLFTDLAKLFVVYWRSLTLSAGVPSASAELAVVEVGSFVASFVPTVGDFDRLDSQFQMPAGTWEQLPEYQSFGFAVFQLKPGAHRVHPMAFEFPRADPRRLFLPTVHIHDGRVHRTAMFDHSLYVQAGLKHLSRWRKTARHDHRPDVNVDEWRQAQMPIESSVDIGRTAGLVVKDKPMIRRNMSGEFDNADVYV